ncbi:E3 ubiquitin ligase PQT3-like isoform X2 [Daucus carota subsp. sativus]|uniref:E3 ubiquitin ligase PQT3-like isoform X2 n=1 Tax=Daucus carota subsp. sativus TaxID=79200 RepID=UPI0007F03401|nr:PREDICTED: uncharacterized protein LOC108206156 isoform X2 [Daucus carota subsp. sativus]
MEVYYKFKSAKEFESLSIDWHYTTVGDLKRNIYYNKCASKRRTHYKDDLIITNAQTHEEYLDGETLIPKNTSVIIRRVPLPRCMPIVITPVSDQDKPLAEKKLQDVEASKNSLSGGDLSVSIYPEESEWEEFWTDMSMPEVVPVQRVPPNKADEDSKIKALIDPPSSDAQCQNSDSFGASRSFERGMGGRSIGRGFGRGVLLERVTPPPGYVCHRCKVPGHFIQHCPTNGDPTFDLKRTKPPTGIPNEDAFEKEIGGMPSIRPVADLPAELYCPLCRAVMKDAVLAGKCCFKSFCDECIRDYIISKSICVCGATNVLADHLLPNNTLRATIARILESNSSSVTNSGSVFQPQALKEDVLALKNKGNTEVEGMAEPVITDNHIQKILGEVTVEIDAEGFEAVQQCVSEPASKMCPPVTDEEMKQKQVSGEVGKKNKKRCADLQSRPHQDFAAENYSTPVEPVGYNSYWNSTLPEFHGFVHPYGGQMPFIGYGPASISFGGAFHHNPFSAQVYMPSLTQRDHAKIETEFNDDGDRDTISHDNDHSAKSKFKSLTPPGRHQPQSERRSPDHITHDPKLLRSSSSWKKKYDDDYYTERSHHRREKECGYRHQSRSGSASRPPVLADNSDEPSLSSKFLTNKARSDCKYKASVSSRITSPKEESADSKKRKLDTSPSAVIGSSHRRSHRMTSNGDHKDHCEIASAGNDYESSDEDRHFKRRRSRYESSPSPPVKEGRHSSRGLKETGVTAASRLSVY